MRHLDSLPGVLLYQFSEVVEILKLNGRFQVKLYGKLIGAFLHLRSVSAMRGRYWFFWVGLSFTCSVALAWLGRHGIFASCELFRSSLTTDFARSGRHA